ncbi:2-oxoglutarate and iron-dependent oxygenase domain-containing protein [Algirhabdus cladophorae]|uniref:2-oxoglutarate and iron-dependent oxygenase domain-containing protein n=1 Tax=Algirhabdus cladophorae TaxID=3377108 RepID=UPI003B84ACA1
MTDTAVQPVDIAAIPIIDIAPLLQGGDSAKVATQIHEAATGPGFFYISGHGIDPCDLGVSRDESRYKPVTAGAHIAGRNRKSFAQYAKRKSWT